MIYGNNYLNGFYQIPENVWSYSMFPMATPTAIMSPQDSLSNLNDHKLFHFNYDANNMLQQSAYMNEYVDNWAKQWNARLTDWYKNMMLNLSSNTQIGGATGIGSLPGIGGAAGAGGAGGAGAAGGAGGVGDNPETMDDLAVWKYMARLGSVDTFGEKFLEKVDLEDGTKSTYVQQLVKLTKDYVTSDSPILTETEFATCKAAAEKMKKTGKIEKADYLALKAIVDAHKGSVEGSGEGDGAGDGDGENADTKIRPNNYLSGRASAHNIADNFYRELYCGDATEADLIKITPSVNMYNVLDIANDFKENYGALKGENIIDAIFDDTTRWGAGSGIWGEGDWLCDDAKPSVERFSFQLIKRTNDIIKINPNMDAATKSELQSLRNKLDAAVKSPKYNTAWHDWSGLDITKEAKKEISKAFQALADKLQEVENNIYGELEDTYFQNYQQQTPTA